MDDVINHYITHHKTILKKLELAKNATLQSIDAAEGIKPFKTQWDDRIEEFNSAWVSEESLFEIEEVLSHMPDDVRPKYEMLVSSELELQSLITELGEFNYETSRKAVRKIQDKQFKKIGLSPDIYEITDEKINIEDGQHTSEYDEATRHFDINKDSE